MMPALEARARELIEAYGGLIATRFRLSDAISTYRRGFIDTIRLEKSPNAVAVARRSPASHGYRT
jgi:hypothetical protein